MSLLSFFGRTLGGLVTGGPVGAVAGAASSLLGPGGSKPVPLSRPQIRTMPQMPSGRMGPSTTITKPAIQIGPGGMIYSQGPTTSTQANFGDVRSGSSTGPAGQPSCGPRGTHLNKTGYYTQAGYIAPGTKWVTNRRRNPLNPRALSRSLSRITSAKRAAKFLDSVEVKRRCRTR